jgi:hypothetical protein
MTKFLSQLTLRTQNLSNMDTWTTQDGTVLKLSEMEASHIENCIKMLRGQIVDPWDVHGYENGAEYGFTHFQIMEDNERKENKIKAFEEELASRNNK